MTDFEKIKEMDIDEILDHDEFAEINFHIVSDSLAEYSIKRIKKATEQHDRLVTLAKEEIAELQAKIQKLDENLERETGYFKMKLYEYFNREDIRKDIKETKTQASYKLLSGSLVFKKPTTKIKRPDDGKLLEILKEIDPLDTYVETIEKPKWAEFKKTLTLSDDGHVIDENGEIIESIEVEDVPGEFNVKL